jgi:ectoine hydroxylase-related dioxygenase (phytanoyl-CoA dioxygenase family)
MPRRYDSAALERFARAVLDDGMCILPQHFSRDTLSAIAAAFRPLLDAHIARDGHLPNRGAQRFYVTLPFVAPFADPALFEDDDILAIVERLVGADPVLCQVATDTPLKGSEHQEIHRDAPPLFPELRVETPPFQLAVNFPLCDVTLDNGPFEIALGTHRIPKDEAMRLLSDGRVRLEPVTMSLGDVMVRDVRALHRGTPNRTDVPRPMAVIGYSRKWLFRPEVSICVPRATYATLSERARRLLRYNPVVESLDEAQAASERYQSFSY